MSRKATDWAWTLNLKAPQKLLMLALADRADEEHCCFPSTQRLVNDTGLDRKTIMKWINQMIDDGLISDTGERKGPTKRVRVLKLHLNFEQYQKRDNSNEDLNGPKNGTISEGNGPKNGTLNCPKNGTLNCPKFGIQNQSLEPVKEPTTKTQVAPAPCEGTPDQSDYMFNGQVIKLNQRDVNNWLALYEYIDLEYELNRLDVEFTYQPPKNWFVTASNKLNYQNQKAKKSGAQKFKQTRIHWNDRKQWDTDFL